MLSLFGYSRQRKVFPLEASATCRPRPKPLKPLSARHSVVKAIDRFLKSADGRKAYHTQALNSKFRQLHQKYEMAGLVALTSFVQSDEQLFLDYLIQNNLFYLFCESLKDVSIDEQAILKAYLVDRKEADLIGIALLLFGPAGHWGFYEFYLNQQLTGMTSLYSSFVFFDRAYQTVSQDYPDHIADYAKCVSDFLSLKEDLCFQLAPKFVENWARIWPEALHNTDYNQSMVDFLNRLNKHIKKLEKQQQKFLEQQEKQRINNEEKIQGLCGILYKTFDFDSVSIRDTRRYVSLGTCQSCQLTIQRRPLIDRFKRHGALTFFDNSKPFSSLNHSGCLPPHFRYTFVQVTSDGFQEYLDTQTGQKVFINEDIDCYTCLSYPLQVDVDLEVQALIRVIDDTYSGRVQFYFNPRLKSRTMLPENWDPSHTPEAWQRLRTSLINKALENSYLAVRYFDCFKSKLEPWQKRLWGLNERSIRRTVSKMSLNQQKLSKIWRYHGQYLIERGWAYERVFADLTDIQFVETIISQKRKWESSKQTLPKYRLALRSLGYSDSYFLNMMLQYKPFNPSEPFSEDTARKFLLRVEQETYYLMYPQHRHLVSSWLFLHEEDAPDSLPDYIQFCLAPGPLVDGFTVDQQFRLNLFNQSNCSSGFMTSSNYKHLLDLSNGVKKQALLLWCKKNCSWTFYLSKLQPKKSCLETGMLCLEATGRARLGADSTAPQEPFLSRIESNYSNSSEPVSSYDSTLPYVDPEQCRRAEREREQNHQNVSLYLQSLNGTL